MSSQLNILLIEDDAIDAESVRRTIARCHLSGKKNIAGANLAHVKYFEEGMGLLAKNPNINLVLLDLHLPDGNGISLVKRLHTQFPQVPVIVLTGLDMEESLGVEMVREGAQDYMPKSRIDESSLTRSIQYSVERHGLASKIAEQSRKLKYSNEELETFTYIASHDLRAPLVNLKGFSMETQRSLNKILPLIEKKFQEFDVDEQATLKKEIQINMPKFLCFISNAAEKMDSLTSAILQLSRLGRRELNFEEIDMDSLVKGCVDTFKHQLESNGASVTISPLPNIVANKTSIEQVFANLLDNAVKYLAANRRGDIRISASQDASLTTFTIADNGRGIAPDDMHKIFEIFRRAGNVENIAGEGMGMPFVRALLKRHNGNIWCESELGTGTRFHFTVDRHLKTKAANYEEAA